MGRIRVGPQAIREYWGRMRERDEHAERTAKGRLFDEVCEVTGSHRKAVIRLLCRPERPRRRRCGGPPVQSTLELTDGTFSTSGDYERFFFKDGRRYHHILDLKRGEPARLSRSVTMVTNRAVIADALAKGVFILGPVRGLALVECIPDVEAVIVGADHLVAHSGGPHSWATVDRVTLGGRSARRM